MKKIAFLLSGRLQDDGALWIESMPELLQIVKVLSGRYEIILIVRRIREKEYPDELQACATVLYDASLPDTEMEADSYASYAQANYVRWDGSETFQMPLVDYVIAWGGISAWSLAAAVKRVPAKRRILWLQHVMSLYMLPEDQDFYGAVFAKFHHIYAGTEEIWKDFMTLFGKNGLRCKVLSPPIDREKYIRLSEEGVQLPYCEEHINLLAAGRMEMYSELEQLPFLASEYRTEYPVLRWFLLGEGPRIPHFWQQIAIYDADQYVTLLGQQENPFPWLSHCDALVISSDDLVPELIKAADIWKIPVIPLSEIEQWIPSLIDKKREAQI